MKKILLIASVLWVATLTAVAATTARDEMRANPLLAANNYLAYPDSDLPAVAAAPAGYEPFFINHYGRHGSRWLISPDSYGMPLRALEKGEQAGKLTPRGREVLAILRQVTQAAEGRLGELSDIGAEQHQRIARRMYQNFPQALSGDARVVARSTVVIRCILSMQNELDMLYSLNPELRISSEAGKSTMYYLNYTDTVVKPLRKSQQPLLDKLRQRWVNPRNMLRNLFGDYKWAQANIENADQVMLNLLDVVGNMQSHHQFEKVNLYDVFSADDIYNAWRYMNARWYILSGETPLTQCRVDYMEANLLRNFIEDGDNAIATGWRGASLRFGHESCVLPLACLMGLNGADYRTTDLETLDKHWVSYRIFPMACNVQLVYYRNAAGDVLVLPLLNERAATLPIATDCAPFYRWSDMRDYFLNKLSRQPDIK